MADYVNRVIAGIGFCGGVKMEDVVVVVGGQLSLLFEGTRGWKMPQRINSPPAVTAARCLWIG